MKVTSPRAGYVEETLFGKLELESWFLAGELECPACGNPYIWKEEGKQIDAGDINIVSVTKKHLIVERNRCIVCGANWRGQMFVWRKVGC